MTCRERRDVEKMSRPCFLRLGTVRGVLGRPSLERRLRQGTQGLCNAPRWSPRRGAFVWRGGSGDPTRIRRSPRDCCRSANDGRNRQIQMIRQLSRWGIHFGNHPIGLGKGRGAIECRRNTRRRQDLRTRYNSSGQGSRGDRTRWGLHGGHPRPVARRKGGGGTSHPSGGWRGNWQWRWRIGPIPPRRQCRWRRTRRMRNAVIHFRERHGRRIARGRSTSAWIVLRHAWFLKNRSTCNPN